MLAIAALSLGAAHAQESRSLAGPWKFQLDAGKAGLAGKWYANPLAGDTSIKLPGTMDDAGLGPKNTKPPTLEGPYRLYDYAGPAWYQRDIDIPSAWQGKRVTLFLERCRWVTTVWLDDKLIGTQDSLIAPHRYDFGIGITPGKHRLTICVDNSVKINLGKFVSALFGGTWGNMNGIIGRIELAATSPVWLEDVQVYPNVANKTALVKVKIGNQSGKAGTGNLVVSVVNHTSPGSDTPATPMPVFVKWDQTGGQVEFEARPQRGEPWDEFKPQLYQLSIDLMDLAGDGKQRLDSRSQLFGLRELSSKGTQFTMNGRPIYLRGTLECSIWPLTGYPPTDVPAWQRIYRIMKSYGLNHIRFHSWCPPEAAFAAADIEGIMIQAEGPMANVGAGADPARDAFIEAEFKRIVDTYGNHPSFCTMTLGNEYGGNNELLSRWVGMLIQRDPRHLYSSASSAPTTANRQWTELATGRGVPSAGTMRDLRDVVAGDARPIMGHEIGQWMCWPDSREIKKWSGVMALKNFEMVRDDLEKKHLLDLEPQFVQASGRFATLLYKEEIEVLLRTPGYAGFSLLDLHDYPTQGTALIGPLDAFWNSKGFITPEAYRKFCGPTVPLLRMPKRTYTIDEPFTATADLSHFGPVDLPEAKPVWSIKDDGGREIASGSLASLRAPTGKLTSLGSFTASLAAAKAPAKLTVTLALNNLSNDWEIWVYPAKSPTLPPSTVMTSHVWDDATKAALADGKRVVLFPDKTNRALTLRGNFMPVFWSPVWFPTQQPNANGILCDPNHALFAKFPTDLHSNWQWWHLLNNSRTLILDDAPATFRPIVQIVDNFARNHKLGNLFEARVGKGSLLVCTMDLPRIAAQQPEAEQLLKGIFTYVGSPAFSPSQALELGLLDNLLTSQQSNTLQKLGAKIHADSEAPGYEAALAIDGDPDTLWHSQWEPSPAPMPHEITLDFPQDATLAGITYLPRQDMPNGRIAACEVFANGQKIASATWRNTDKLQTLRFSQPLTTRSLRLVIKSEVNGNPFAGIAELDVLAK